MHSARLLICLDDLSLKAHFATQEHLHTDQSIDSHFNEKRYTKGLIGNDTRIGPPLGVVVTRRYNPYGVEINIDSRMNDGTKCWVGIIRGV